MFIVEILDGIWKEGSRHTQEVDAETQVEIFKKTGIDAVNLRITNGS